MDISTIVALAKIKVLDLAYIISKKIDMNEKWDEQVQSGQLLSLIRVLENTDSLLTDAKQQQLLQGLISIGELII